MSLLWKTATTAVDPATVDHSYHTAHGLNHWATKAGFKESPCGYASCPNFDEDHFNAMDQAESLRTTKGKFQVIDSQHANLHAMEPHIDDETLAAYRQKTPPKKFLPHIFTHKGKTHILDGHHRLIADSLEGRKTPLIHTNLDKED